jgi:SAM-dependent methyltransferase
MRVRVCLCRRWPLSPIVSASFDLPRFELCRRQSDSLRGARSRLLRRAGIERRNTIVEIGAGWGIVANELCSRTGRTVIALDRHPQPSEAVLNEHVDWVVGRAEDLPMANESVDLLFAQFTFLWLDVAKSIAEVVRVLAPGGVVSVIEPDYGGLMEFPEGIVTQSVWIAALKRVGADPTVGRKLPGKFAEAGLRVETRFADRYETADPRRLDFLTELPLTGQERRQIEPIDQWLKQHPGEGTSHLPLWMVLGEKPDCRRSLRRS